MIISRDTDIAFSGLIWKIIKNSTICQSRFGSFISAPPTLIVVENPEFSFKKDPYINVYDEVYYQRFEILVQEIAEKLKNTPFTRRASIPIWRPADHLTINPPAITEISFLIDDGKLHLTAFLRSLDCLNYFFINFDFLLTCLEKVSKLTENELGSLGMLISIPHIYVRDKERAETFAKRVKEKYGYHHLATHLVEDYISSAWHTALDVIIQNGKKKRTEWGEFFSGQENTLSIHRMLIEVVNPEENKIHDKAPFTRKYGVEYAHNYVIYAAKMFEEVKGPILNRNEEYTYAERARYCEKDNPKVDQLYTSVIKLKGDRCRRDCYVGISRYWDILSSDPPCLRGYQFFKFNDTLYSVFYMRSNDAYGAMHANMFAFSILSKYVAEFLGIKNYRYVHFALDAHVYEQFIDAVKDILYPSSPSFQFK